MRFLFRKLRIILRDVWYYEKLLLSLRTRKYAGIGLQQIKVLTG